MDTNVFNRIEKKYLISKDQYKKLQKLAKEQMRPDNYHKSEVLNLYFDTDNYDLIIQSIDHPIFKEKLRARSYSGYDRVFLEIKTKLKGRDNNFGYKRRVMITHDDFDKLLARQQTLTKLAEQSLEFASDLQIAREIDYLINHMNLNPKILLTYKRESYKGENNLRLTFDSKLKYRNTNLNLNKAKHDKIYFKDNHNIIMEVKAHGVMPLWLVKKLSELHIYPQQFSKIGKIYERIVKEQNV